MIKKKIKMDLSISNAPQVVYAVQGDTNTRNVVIDLYNAGAAWTVPDGASGVVKFQKADGKGGIYDKLPNGFPAVVYEENSNQIEVSLAPQMLTFPGEVKAQVSLIYDNNIISTFAFVVLVQADPSANVEKSADYVNWDRYFIPQTSGASVGQYLKITKVDDFGRVVGVSPVDAPPGSATIDGDLDMKSNSILNVGTVEFWNDDELATVIIQSEFPEGDNESENFNGVIEFRTSRGDEPVVIRNVADAKNPNEAVSKKQLDESMDHSQLSNRDAVDQHPIGAIAGLEKKLADLESGSIGPQGPKGEKGDPGPTGPQGLPGAAQTPLFANSVEECTDTSKVYVLPDGYIYAYMKSTKPRYTNLLLSATDAEGNIYNSVGYKQNVRISVSSGYTETSAAGFYLTGFIPVPLDGVVRLQNITMPNSDGYGAILYIYDSSKNGLCSVHNNLLSDRKCSPVFDENGNLSQFTAVSKLFTTGFSGGYIRFGTTHMDDTSIITVNQEITQGDGSSFAWENTGHAFVPAYYEDRIVDLENKAVEQKTTNQEVAGRLTEVEKLVVSELPDYVLAELESVRDALYAKMVLGNVAVIGFSTDQHISKWTGDMQTNTNTTGTLAGLKALRNLTQALPFNLVALGGDYVTGGSAESVQEETLMVFQQLAGANCPVIGITGNHDAWQNADCSNAVLFKSHTAAAVINHPQFISLNNESCNGYIDDKTVNIRFIFCDAEPHGGSSGAYYNLNDAKAALQTMLEGIPQGYKAVIFSHKPIHNGLGWKDGLGWQSLIAPMADRIICCINGHGHVDADSVADGILYIQTRSASPTDYNGNADLSAVGTADETAFDVFVIDQDTNTIYAIRYGAGENREFAY